MRDILERMRKAARFCIIYEDGSKHREQAFADLNDAIKDYQAIQQKRTLDLLPCGHDSNFYRDLGNGVYGCTECTVISY